MGCCPSDKHVEHGVKEMVSMITIQRAYEAGQKVIQAEDETLEMATSQVGRIG